LIAKRFGTYVSLRNLKRKYIVPQGRCPFLGELGFFPKKIHFSPKKLCFSQRNFSYFMENLLGFALSFILLGEVTS
jgi:hypothetical protein